MRAKWVAVCTGARQERVICIAMILGGICRSALVFNAEMNFQNWHTRCRWNVNQTKRTR